MKIVFAILTALALVGNQCAVLSSAVAATACCGNCDGACCVKDCAPSVPSEPLAPAPLNGAPNVELILNALAVLAFVSTEFAPPQPVRPEPVFASPRPLFQRFCVYLI